MCYLASEEAVWSVFKTIIVSLFCFVFFFSFFLENSRCATKNGPFDSL